MRLETSDGSNVALLSVVYEALAAWLCGFVSDSVWR